jgi:hypothetical protein
MDREGNTVYAVDYLATNAHVLLAMLRRPGTARHGATDRDPG